MKVDVCGGFWGKLVVRSGGGHELNLVYICMYKFSKSQ